MVDTSAALGFLRGENKSVKAVRSALEATDAVGISVISLFELLHPIHRRKLERQERMVKSFFHQMKLLPLDSACADESARIMGGLLKTGQAVNALDVLIAGTAVANGAEKLISADRAYEKIASVSDLKTEIVA
ncbi:MAG TPA: type II toxin-antitoxin system VapC family toxin [Nitrososphaerales archaeon]|nr:type II toxin-antitoxin system VapC family toxin [Nitrososphaerales archaeon]